MAGEGSSQPLPLDAQDNQAVWGAIAHLESKLDSFAADMRQMLAQFVNQGAHRDADPVPPRVHDPAPPRVLDPHPLRDPPRHRPR